jgi:large subunit ribosomal protein L13
VIDALGEGVFEARALDGAVHADLAGDVDADAVEAAARGLHSAGLSWEGGRLASQAAILLRGKHKPYYAPHLDTGDFVVIVNAGKVAMTGKKAEQSTVYNHSGFPGGLKRTSYADVLATRPERIIEKAIKGMLPHNTLGRQMLSKLKVYAGPTHPHQAQAPVPYELKQVSQ